LYQTEKCYGSHSPLTLLATWTLDVTNGAGVDKVVVGFNPSSRLVPPWPETNNANIPNYKQSEASIYNCE